MRQLSRNGAGKEISPECEIASNPSARPFVYRGEGYVEIHMQIPKA